MSWDLPPRGTATGSGWRQTSNDEGTRSVTCDVFCDEKSIPPSLGPHHTRGRILHCTRCMYATYDAPYLAKHFLSSLTARWTRRHVMNTAYRHETPRLCHGQPSRPQIHAVAISKTYCGWRAHPHHPEHSRRALCVVRPPSRSSVVYVASRKDPAGAASSPRRNRWRCRSGR